MARTLGVEAVETKKSCLQNESGCGLIVALDSPKTPVLFKGVKNSSEMAFFNFFF